jgi:integrase
VESNPALTSLPTRQLGHTDPAFTLRLYTHTMRREDEERTRLQALVDGVAWAQRAP